MADIFGRTVDFGSSFAADKATLSLPGTSGTDLRDLTGFLVQNLQLQYSQQITKLYEVGGTKIYYVGGRTQGQATLSRIVGPKALSKAFYDTYGDICKMSATGNNIKFDIKGAECSGGAQGSGQAGGATINYTAKFCLITTVGFSVQAQDMLINESTTLMIGMLEYEG